MRRLEYKWLVGITFVLALIMQILDVTILNVALATLGREFQAEPAQLQWVLTGYMVSLAVFIPSSGWIADRFGSKKTFQAAVIIFTLASMLCGMAMSMEMLVGSRILQGVGGGMLVPVGQAMMFRAFPANERAKAGAVLAIPITVAPMLGPLLGGVLVEYASWRWIFFINLPVGALALLFTILFLKEESTRDPGRFDVPGFVLAGAGLATLLVGLDQGSQIGWTSPAVWLSLAASVLLIGGLVWRELTVTSPMLDLRLLANRLFGTGNLLLLCMTGAMFGVLFLIPLYLQTLRGVSPMFTGLTLMPQAIAMLATTQVVSRAYGRIGPKRLIIAGFVVQLIIGGLLQLQNLSTPLWALALMLATQGVAMGLLMTPVQTATFAAISGPAMGMASSMFNVTRQVATALGTAVVATVLTVLVQRGESTVDPTVPAMVADAQMSAFHGAFLVSVVFAVLGIVLALRVRDADAAATLDRPKAAARQGEPEPSEP